MKLNVKAFSLTCGILLGMTLFIFTWYVIAFEGPIGFISPISHVYRGYTVSPWGSIIGLAWGLADGLVGGAVFAWLYNLLVARLGDTGRAS